MVQVITTTQFVLIVLITLYIISFFRNFFRMALCMCGNHISPYGLLVSFLPMGISDLVMEKYWEKKWDNNMDKINVVDEFKKNGGKK